MRLPFWALGLLLSVPLSAQSITLSCTGPCGTSGYSANCGYGFYRSADGGATFDALNPTTPSSTCSYTDTNVAHNGATYKYYAITIDPSFRPSVSGMSNVTSSTMPLPDSPAYFDSTVPASGSILTYPSTFTWVNNPGSNVAHYQILVSELGGSNNNGTWNVSATTWSGTLWSNSGVTVNGNVALEINLRTVYNDGTFTNVPYFYLEPTPAGIPQIYSPIPSTAQCGQALAISWSAGPSDTTGYYIHGGTTAGGFDIWNTGPTTSTTATINIHPGGFAPGIAWLQIEATSPSKGNVFSPVYGAPYVACNSIN